MMDEAFCGYVDEDASSSSSHDDDYGYYPDDLEVCDDDDCEDYDFDHNMGL